VKMEVEGKIVRKPDTDYSINVAGYVIHGAIHKARPDVGCVLHTHTRAGMAVAAMKCGLLPLSQTSIRFVGHIGYHDYEGPAIDVNERERLVRDLGGHKSMIMRKHGLLTRGPSIQETFNKKYQLQMSCRSQVHAKAARTELTRPDENVLAHTANLYQPGTGGPIACLNGRRCSGSSPRKRRIPVIRRTGSSKISVRLRRKRGPRPYCKPWIPAYAGMSGGYLENLALQPRVPYRPPHALPRRRHFDMAHAENRKRIDDGVDDHGEGRHRAAFAGRPDAERMGG